MYAQGQGTADDGTGPPTSKSGAAPQPFRDLRDLCPQETRGTGGPASPMLSGPGDSEQTHSANVQRGGNH